VAGPDELALHPPVPPRRVICCHADHELADRSCYGLPAGMPSAGVVPSAGDQAPVLPGERCRRGHRERLGPPASGDQPRQGGEPQPVGWLMTDPADLAAQHRVLVPEHQELGVLGRLTPSQHLEAGEQTACDQVDAQGDRSGMISAASLARRDRIIEPHTVGSWPAGAAGRRPVRRWRPAAAAPLPGPVQPRGTQTGSESRPGALGASTGFEHGRPPGRRGGWSGGRHDGQSWMRRIWPCPAPKPKPWLET
jgi:hypothetical protein